MTEHAIESRLATEWDEAVAIIPPIGVRAIEDASAPDRASRVALMAELEDLRLWMADLHEAIDRTGTARTRATTLWTVQDVIAHLASWGVQTRREVEIILSDGRFDETIHFEAVAGPRTWNQREVDARAARDLASLVGELDEEIARLIELVLTAPQSALDAVTELPRTSGDPPRPWRRPLNALIAMSCWHVRHHFVRLEEIVRAQ